MQCNAELNVHWEQREIMLKVHLHKYSWQPPDFPLLINFLENTKKCVTLYKWLEIDNLYPWDWMWCSCGPLADMGFTSLGTTVSLCRRWKIQDLDYFFQLCRQKNPQSNTEKTTKAPNTLGCKSWWVNMLKEKQKVKTKTFTYSTDWIHIQE